MIHIPYPRESNQAKIFPDKTENIIITQLGKVLVLEIYIYIEI